MLTNGPRWFVMVLNGFRSLFFVFRPVRFNRDNQTIYLSFKSKCGKLWNIIWALVMAKTFQYLLPHSFTG